MPTITVAVSTIIVAWLVIPTVVTTRVLVVSAGARGAGPPVVRIVVRIHPVHLAV
jgi:hypothetical protein